MKNTAAFAVVAAVPATLPALSYMITRFLVADVPVDKLERADFPSASACSKEVPANRVPVISNIPEFSLEKSKLDTTLLKAMDEDEPRLAAVIPKEPICRSSVPTRKSLIRSPNSVIAECGTLRLMDVFSTFRCSFLLIPNGCLVGSFATTSRCFDLLASQTKPKEARLTS